MRSFDPNYDATRISNMYVANARQGRVALRTSEGLPSWDESGNQLTNTDPAFPLDAQSGHYNSLYAVLGDPDWPVPNPITSSNVPGFPYTSVVGDFSQNYTYSNTTDSTMYVQIFVDPTCAYPVTVANAIALDYYTLDVNALAFSTSSTMNAVPFVQVDPRLMVWGKYVDSSSYPTNPEGSPVKALNLQQIMGGQVNVKFSCPWESTAEVCIGDPMVAPTICGPKMTKWSAYTSALSNAMCTGVRSAYNIAGTSVLSGNVLTPKVQISAADVNTCATRRFVLVGAGSSSTLDTTARLLPTQETWNTGPLLTTDGVLSFYQYNPTPFSGRQFYSVKLQPNMSISIDVSGWVSYNVSVDVTGGAGLALAQHCPMTRPHLSNVHNIPITVGTDFKGRSDYDLTKSYIGCSVPLQRQSNNGQSVPVAKLDSNSFSSKASAIMQKFIPVAKELAIKYAPQLKRGMSAFGRLATSKLMNVVAQRLPSLASAAPLLLM